MRSTASSMARRAHVERLTVPWWGAVAALGLALLLAAEIHLGHDGVRAWAPYLVLPPLAGLLVAWAGRLRVAVDDGELLVDDARVPVRFLIAAERLGPADKRTALGPELDPLAFVVQRPWIRDAVRVYLDDPADPTPYWIVSTKHPDALLAALDLPLPAPAEPVGHPAGGPVSR